MIANKALKPDLSIIVGVSGGPDSLCLLDMLDKAGYPLIIAHFYHGLRAEAELEGEQVRQQAERRGLEFTTGRGDVRQFARMHSLSIEEAARKLRYRFLFDMARERGAQAVAVGHNANDQVETVLMHFLRGAGLSGLSGMRAFSLPNAWSKDIPLLRPLLSIWRDEIMAYLEEQNLQPAIDLTNQDIAFFRNRLRHELIPVLEDYIPGLRERIGHMAQILAGDDAVLEAAVQQAWAVCRGRQERETVSFERRPFLEQMEAIQRRLVRRAFAELRPDLRDLDFEAVEQALAFARQPSRSRNCDLTGGLLLFLEQGRLWFAAGEQDLPGEHWPQVPAGASLSLPVPGRVDLPGGWELTAESLPGSESVFEQVRENDDPFQAWVEAGRLSGGGPGGKGFRVRGRENGDRFSPLGLDGHSQKLSDFMINERIPRRARPRWPLVVDQAEIVWIPGYRPSHPWRVTTSSQVLVHLKMSLIEKDRS